jgi:hypothetical protein
MMCKILVGESRNEGHVTLITSEIKDTMFGFGEEWLCYTLLVDMQENDKNTV